MEQIADTTKDLRAYLLEQHDPGWGARNGIQAKSQTELLKLVMAEDPDARSAILMRVFGIPRLEETARRFGVDPAKLKAHVEAGDVDEWLAERGVDVVDAAKEEIEPERMRRRDTAARDFGFDFVGTLPEGVLHGSTFEGFNDEPGTDESRAAVEEWTAGVGPPLLTIAGMYGAGKTHLLLAAGSALSGQGVYYREEDALLEDWRRSMRAGDDSHRQFMEVPHLIVDDLGRTGATDTAKGFLDALVDYRYARQMRTLIATNLKGGAFEAQGMARIASRLRDVAVGRTIVMEGASDYRSRRPA